MKFKLLTGILALLFVLGAVTTGAVLAHAEIERSNPEADTTVEGSPAMVEIWFSQEISKESTIEVIDSNQKSVTSGDTELDLFDPDRKHLIVELQPNLPDGVYTVNWSSVSAEDGDTETGSFAFTVTESGTPVASPVASPVANAGTPAAAHVSGSLQDASETGKEPVKIDGRSFAIAVGAGVIVAFFIYGFWWLVRPRKQKIERNPLDRTPPQDHPDPTTN